MSWSSTSDWTSSQEEQGFALDRGLSKRHRAIVRFTTLQFFVMIYLQKIAIGSLAFQISLPMIITLFSIAWMVVFKKLSFSPIRLASYLVFVSFCLFSQILSGVLIGVPGSFPSFLQVILLYISLAIATDLTESDFQQYVLDRFVKLMVLPALIIFVQYFYQKLTGLADPINMNAMLPKTLLMQGFSYNSPYVWGATFSRPNGFFFLEPSTVSLYTASAAVIELTYFRRYRYLILMLAATALSIGGTGFTVLIVATPLILVRNFPPHVWIIAIGVAIVGLVVAYALGVPLPLLSRLDELNHEGYSGSQRLLIPAVRFVEIVLDPSYLVTGTGAGSTTVDLGNPWPILKIANEYGILAMVSFVVFYGIVMTGNRSNIPLKVALSVIFHFTGGYLVDPFMVNFLAILCMNRPPERNPVAAWALSLKGPRVQDALS